MRRGQAQNRHRFGTRSLQAVPHTSGQAGNDQSIAGPSTAPTDHRPTLGEAGERAAARYLTARGWEIVARNARTRYGEIDLICRSADHALVFVEVKALRGRDRAAAERALESIGPRKRLQVRRLARAWLADNRPRSGASYEEIHFDAIGVSIGPRGRPNGLVHVPAAF